MRMFAFAAALAVALTMIGTAPAQSPDADAASLKRAEATITGTNLLRHIKELSSDVYTGRAPGTDGETKSIAYLIEQCRAIGLEPGSPTSSWTQTVPLWGMLSQASTISFSVTGKQIPLVAGQDYTAWTSLPLAKVDIASSGVIFAGYGVVAPEYHWDDYAGIDVRGKTVLVLTGDPPVASATDPTQLDERMFLGRALTVYGRTGTKLETAWKHGAAAVILIASPGLASPQFLFSNYTREIMTLRGAGEQDHVRAQAVMLSERVEELFSAAGANYQVLHDAAAKPGFRAVPIAAEASFHVKSRVRKVDSENVVAKITGSDPILKKEYVVYSAHWDHHGQVGIKIFHGASDNAAGTAGVLELARALKSLSPAARRSFLFLWPTAEEKGLLGARYYVEHPLYPLQQTVADINLDYFSNWGWGRTHDFSIVGIGNSTLDDVAAAAVKAQGRVTTGDTAPEQGFYFRSDHYEFARLGVPSIETSPGIDYVGKPADFGIQKRTEYISHDYHQPSDVIKPDWDLSGAVEDLQILLDVGFHVAQQDSRPAWKEAAIWRPRSE
jgi:Zn-dependent M28 family amino/carboxypeptidase